MHLSFGSVSGMGIESCFSRFPMNRRLFIIAGLAAFVLMAVFDWLLNVVVLAELYEISKGVWRSRSAQEALYPLAFLNYLFISFIFVALFVRGYRNKGWAEGVRFGLIFGAAIATSSAIQKYVLLEIPVQLALGWFMGLLFIYMILGLIVALIYREA